MPQKMMTVFKVNGIEVLAATHSSHTVTDYQDESILASAEAMLHSDMLTV
jgi:hypothetical protein